MRHVLDEHASWPRASVRRGLESAVTLDTALRVALYVVVTGIGALLRLVALWHFQGHIDEPASLLAIQRVAEVGYPLYPSGALYLQGAAFSYLAAPLAWIVDKGLLLLGSRILNLGLSLTVIPLSMKLTHVLTRNLFVTVLVGILVAGDPQLMVWSVAIRPYAMLAPVVMALLLLFTLLLKHGPSARLLFVPVVIWLPIVATLGTFTHIGFWLTFPSLAVGALLFWRSALLTTHRAILLSGVMSFLPLLAFLALGRLVGTGAGTGDGLVGSSIVGSHLFNVQRLLSAPDIVWWMWTGNFVEGEFFELIPFLIALASGVLLSAVVMSPPRDDENWRLAAIGTIVLTHWTIIGAVALLVISDPATRYLNQVLPIGYVLIGLAVWYLWRVNRQRGIALIRLVQAGVVIGFVIPTLLYIGTAAEWRIQYTGGSPDYWRATAWTARQMQPDDIAITVLPPSAYFWFSDEQIDQLLFLAGPANRPRTDRYIRTNMDGQPGDYWLGVPPIDSTEQLCTTLLDHPGAAWIIVDSGRLRASWALRGQMQTILYGSTDEQFRGHRNVLVLLAAPFGEWSGDARAACDYRDERRTP